MSEKIGEAVSKRNPINVEILELKNKFVNHESIDIATTDLLYDICSLFELDRIMIGMKNMDEDTCMPIAKFDLETGMSFLNVYGDSAVSDFDSFVKLATFSTKEIEEKYMYLCDNNSYFEGEEFLNVKGILSELGCSYINNPTECIINYIKSETSFSYMIMERYNTEVPKLSYADRLALRDIYSLFSMRVKKEESERRLFDETGLKNVIIDNEQMPICMVTQKEHKILYYNELYKKVLPNVKVGKYCYELFGKDEHCPVCCTEAVRLQAHVGTNSKYWIKKSVPFTLSDGTPVYVIYAKDTDDYIKQLAGVDLLTSAYSTKGFSDYFVKIMKTSKDSFFICTIDIARFKYINDSFGFETGNRILQKVASVIDSSIRNPETFCRLNEDKFCMLLKAIDKQELQNRIKRIYAKLEEMQNKHLLDMRLTYIGGAVKVDKKIPVNVLIDHANNARKTAKGSHTSKLAFFDEALELKIQEEISIEKRISKAVEDGEFIPYLQPKFDLETSEICGAEALVRWVTPTGMIYPDKFIPLFEKNGFIDTLDFIVYRKVMEHIRYCLDNNFKVYPISLNVSRNHIHNKNFVNQVMELINEYDIPINLLELEITESIFVEDKEVLKYFVENIKRPKIKVSIDDFGTAYSSLQVLKDIDIDILKIDKSFLENIDFTDEHSFTKDEVVLKNIINLAKDLNCKVICEGIETKEQIKLLKNIGCEYGQGFVFARPMPIRDYTERFMKISQDVQ